MLDRSGSVSDHALPRGADRLCAIVSAANRLGVAAATAALRGRLSDQVDLEIQIVNSSAEATAAARQAAAAANVVIAVGGDGTVADVATGMFGSRATLGIVPAGSTNITARSLGIPPRPEAAVDLLGSPHARRTIDVGRSDERSFLHIAGAGFDAELFKTADPRWKRRLGWFAYLPAAAAALRLPPSRVQITADDALIEATSALVLIANGDSAIAPGFRIYPDIAVDDGWLDVIIFTSTTPVQIASTLGYASRQRLELSPHVNRHRARRVQIVAIPNLSVQLDGDPRGTTPREFQIVPAGLQVIIPKP